MAAVAFEGSEKLRTQGMRVRARSGAVAQAEDITERKGL
jgi:hypothetical protein